MVSFIKENFGKVKLGKGKNEYTTRGSRDVIQIA